MNVHAGTPAVRKLARRADPIVRPVDPDDVTLVFSVDQLDFTTASAIRAKRSRSSAERENESSAEGETLDQTVGRQGHALHRRGMLRRLRAAYAAFIAG